MIRAMRLVIPLLVIALAVGMLSGGTVLAAKGGKGGGGVGTASATLSASPNPAAAGSVVRVQGCGYALNVGGVEARIVHATYTQAYRVGLWATGCIDFTFRTAEAGTYRIEAYQLSSLKASASLTVQ